MIEKENTFPDGFAESQINTRSIPRNNTLSEGKPLPSKKEEGEDIPIKKLKRELNEFRKFSWSLLLVYITTYIVYQALIIVLKDAGVRMNGEDVVLLSILTMSGLLFVVFIVNSLDRLGNTWSSED